MSCKSRTHQPTFARSVALKLERSRYLLGRRAPRSHPVEPPRRAPRTQAPQRSQFRVGASPSPHLDIPLPRSGPALRNDANASRRRTRNVNGRELVRGKGRGQRPLAPCGRLRPAGRLVASSTSAAMRIARIHPERASAPRSSANLNQESVTVRHPRGHESVSQSNSWTKGVYQGVRRDKSP